MRILNVRLGHACNSSSSHSIIWFDGEAETDETEDFGWSYFTAANTEARRNYAALLVASRVTRTFKSLGWQDRDVLTKAYVRDVLGVVVPKDAYIDHESAEDRFNLPTHADGTVHSEFAKDFVKWFSRAPIAVLGGNDNDEETHPLDHAGKSVSFVYGFNGIARKDPTYGFWTVFDPKSGNKIRVDFETATGPDWEPPTRGSAPELVDLKITDYCPYGCSFCYMGSTTRGQHADREWVQKAATELANMGVFEVAIGGGEPTLHPEFERIVADLKQHNMNVNFTTKNLSWLRDPVRAKAITESCSAFAYSVDTGEDVRALSDAWRASPYRDNIQAVAQVVVGGVESYFFEDILKECKRLDIPVTLLGFKTTGRGEAFKQKVYDWKALVRKAGLRQVGIDTVLAATLDVTDKVDAVFYHKHEGAWSMYVDAVERKAGPSSYCDENAKVDVEKFYPHDKERKWPLCGPLLPVFQGFEIPK
jgi:hypothetical protein